MFQIRNIKPLVAINSLLFLFFISESTLLAQPNVGISTYYGTKIESFGLNIFGNYPLGEKTKIGLDVVWWPQSAPDDSRYLFTEANINLNFTLFTTNRFSFDASLMAGYHYAGTRFKTLGENYRASKHMEAFGAGAGIVYDLRSFALTIRVRKFFYSGFNQLNIGGGIQIDI